LSARKQLKQKDTSVYQKQLLQTYLPNNNRQFSLPPHNQTNIGEQQLGHLGLTPQTKDHLAL
jgi:hypothetical protein